MSQTIVFREHGDEWRVTVDTDHVGGRYGARFTPKTERDFHDVAIQSVCFVVEKLGETPVLEGYPYEFDVDAMVARLQRAKERRAARTGDA